MTVDKRAVLSRAVGNGPLAVENQQQYRPRESPAKRHIVDCAGDAVGILRGSSGKTNAVFYFAGQPHRLGVLKAVFNIVVAEEQAFGALGA